VEINLKENIFYKSYNNKVDLNEEIVNFIFSDKIDKVLYKGDPNLINYKLLKKIIPMNETRVEPDKVRSKYSNILELTDNAAYCVIYKK
jgi:hypothetical protein